MNVKKDLMLRKREKSFFRALKMMEEEKMEKFLRFLLTEGELENIISKWNSHLELCVASAHRPLLENEVPATFKPRVARHGSAMKIEKLRELALEQLRKLANKHNGVISTQIINMGWRRGECFRYARMLELFGSLSEARKRIGARSSFLTDEQVLEKLRKFAKKLGKRPTLEDVDKGSKERLAPGRNVLRTRFGSFTRALKLAKIK